MAEKLRAELEQVQDHLVVADAVGMPFEASLHRAHLVELVELVERAVGRRLDPAPWLRLDLPGPTPLDEDW